MSVERLVWQGQKQEKIKEAKRLEISIGNLRSDIRMALNPHGAIIEIDQEAMVGHAFELSDKLIRYKQLCREIDAINKSLGTT